MIPQIFSFEDLHNSFNMVVFMKLCPPCLLIAKIDHPFISALLVFMA